MDTKICLTCKETLDICAFTKRSNRKENDYQPHCNKCRSIARNERSRNLKAKAIEYKGGKCNDCLQVVHQAAFEFHHLNPDTKADKDPAHFLRDNKELSDETKQELDKCVLLCANCHRVRHFSDLF